MNAKSAKNYSVMNLGKLDDLKNYSFGLPGSDFKLEGKKFLKEELGLTAMEVSINRLEPGAGMPFFHKHNENEEFYLFIKGEGEFQIDEEIFPVKEGTAIKIAPDAERIWRNNTKNPLYYIVVQAKAGSLNKGDIQDGKLVKWDKPN